MIARQKMFLLLTLVTLTASTPVMAHGPNALLPGNTLEMVRLELWSVGLNQDQNERQENTQSAVSQPQTPEELTLGLEKWQSSL